MAGTTARRCELWARSQSEGLGSIRIRVHARPRWSRESIWNIRHWFSERRLTRRRGSWVEPLRLTVRLALGAKWVWEILRLRLTLLLWLLRSFCISRVAGITVGSWLIVLVSRIHGVLLCRAGAVARIIMLLRAPIIAIDRLAHWRSALHHVGSLRRHRGSAVIGPHLWLRSHCLGAACHGGTGAEYVCECRVPCSPRLAIWRARELPPLLIAVVCHVASSVRSAS
jgi:hypothetical protein